MNDVVSVRKEGAVVVVSVNAPPVNALGIRVRRGLMDVFADLRLDDSIGAVVLICEGRTFFAGADVSEFGKPREAPILPVVSDAIENCGKLTVAAINGAALGGGLEIALVCDFRVAVHSAKLGLPEVKLGLMPGAGGTQRLPRLIGIEPALDVITSGRSVPAREALDLGLIDRVVEPDTLEVEALKMAHEALADGEEKSKLRDREGCIEIARSDPNLFVRYRVADAGRLRSSAAADKIVQAVQAAVHLSFEAGLKKERELFEVLEVSCESRGQQHAFFAERGTTKVPGLDLSQALDVIQRAAVIGAGTMGAGITMTFLNAGIPVTLVEREQSALERGVALIQRNYQATAAKGRITADQVAERMALITPAIDLAASADADLVIEAVFEELAIKKELFAELDTIAKPGAILASNTSYLDLDEIAAATSRPEWVVGLHFFSPANVMRLVEVVKGARTSNEVVATAMALAKRLDKVPVLSRVCHGFIANRIMSKRRIQAELLVLEGPTLSQIDDVLKEYGFVIGPFQMADLVGLDVLGRESSERTLRGDLVKLGRLGFKSGSGFYDYDKTRRPIPSPVAERVVSDFASFRGVHRSGAVSAQDILFRLLLPVVNEGAKVLEEGVALRASDIDASALLGFNWPSMRGGPMFWADELGLPTVVEELRKLQAVHGDDFRPAVLLERLAAEGKYFTR